MKTKTRALIGWLGIYAGKKSKQKLPFYLDLICNVSTNILGTHRKGTSGNSAFPDEKSDKVNQTWVEQSKPNLRDNLHVSCVHRGNDP